jgi:hypothetical protein
VGVIVCVFDTVCVCVGFVCVFFILKIINPPGCTQKQHTAAGRYTPKFVVLLKVK